jgi:hypothetical protein
MLRLIVTVNTKRFTILTNVYRTVTDLCCSRLYAIQRNILEPMYSFSSLFLQPIKNKNKSLLITPYMVVQLLAVSDNL